MQLGDFIHSLKNKWAVLLYIIIYKCFCFSDRSQPQSTLILRRVFCIVFFGLKDVSGLGFINVSVFVSVAVRVFSWHQRPSQPSPWGLRSWLTPKTPFRTRRLVASCLWTRGCTQVYPKSIFACYLENFRGREDPWRHPWIHQTHLVRVFTYAFMLHSETLMFANRRFYLSW